MDPAGFFGRNSAGNAGNPILMVLWILGSLKQERLSPSIAVSWESAPGSQEDAPQASPS